MRVPTTTYILCALRKIRNIFSALLPVTVNLLIYAVIDKIAFVAMNEAW